MEDSFSPSGVVRPIFRSIGQIVIDLLAQFVDLHFDWEKKALSDRDPLLKLDAERARNLRHAYGLRIARNLREARVG